MKQIFLSIGIYLGAMVALSAQVQNPAQWQVSIQKKTDLQYNIVARATIKNNWHIYGIKKVNGPIPTSIQITPHPLIQLDGKVQEIGKKITKYEDIFSTNVEYYENTLTIIQPIKIKTKAKITITGNVNFMACDDKNCTPPHKIPFSLSIQ